MKKQAEKRQTIAELKNALDLKTALFGVVIASYDDLLADRKRIMGEFIPRVEKLEHADKEKLEHAHKELAATQEALAQLREEYKQSEARAEDRIGSRDHAIVTQKFELETMRSTYGVERDDNKRLRQELVVANAETHRLNCELAVATQRLSESIHIPNPNLRRILKRLFA